jgi:porphobilinogen deaminase
VINILRIGTRGSKLALLQAETVKSLLAHNGVESKLVMNGQPVEYGEALFAIRAV